jgi:hypothetical protein
MKIIQTEVPMISLLLTLEEARILYLSIQPDEVSPELDRETAKQIETELGDLV